MLNTEPQKNGQGSKVGPLLKGHPSAWKIGANQGILIVLHMAMDLVGSLFYVAYGGPGRRGLLTDSEKGCISGLLSAAELKPMVRMRPSAGFRQRRPQTSLLDSASSWGQLINPRP